MGFWKQNNLVMITLGVVTYLYLVVLNTLPRSVDIFLSDYVIMTSILLLGLLTVWYGKYKKERNFYESFTKKNPIAKVLKKEGYLDTLMTVLTISEVTFIFAGFLYVGAIIMNSLPYIYVATLLVTLGNVCLILAHFRNQEMKTKCRIPVKVKK